MDSSLVFNSVIAPFANPADYPFLNYTITEVRKNHQKLEQLPDWVNCDSVNKTVNGFPEEV
ncbi:MAG: hypothetical protein AB7O73_09050 [Bacteroidia bacterium]